MKLIKSQKKTYNHVLVDEKLLDNVDFKIHKLTNNSKPKDKNKVLLICCFSEFGCETVGVMYTIPQIILQNSDKYIIVVGWQGRKYFYQHLVDEFWEINDEHMWLREFARAFHHESKNLKSLEKGLEQYGIVIPSAKLGDLSILERCADCNENWNTVFNDGEKYNCKFCPKCNGSKIIPPIIGDVNYWKPKAIRLPNPSQDKMNLANSYLKRPTVGIFARGRKCYGRNLQPEFYIRLISILEDLGYNPIWLGEKVSVQPCPVSHIIDFSRMEESKDLEFTLSLIKNCHFTIQFWTASTRLSGMIGVPYILFESPDQIWGKKGQEGIRRNLCDMGRRKLSVNHFLNVYDNNEQGLEVVKKCIEEIRSGNYEDMIGMVEDYSLVLGIKNSNDKRIGA